MPGINLQPEYEDCFGPEMDLSTGQKFSLRVTARKVGLALGLIDIIICESYNRGLVDGHRRLGRWVFQRRRRNILHEEVQTFLQEAGSHA